MLDLRNIDKQFHGQKVLQNVSLTVQPAEFFSLLGPSGCGKSTLLRLIAGFDEPSQGSIFFDGSEVTQVGSHKRPFNMIFQRYALFPHLSVEENVGFSLALRKVARAEMKREVSKALDLVAMRGFEQRYPLTLSGGQQQRIAIAQAIVAKPRVLLLDEPFSALDLKLRLQMQQDLRALQRQLGMTFIFVTHDQTEAMTMSDRIGVMEAGRIVEIGTPEELYLKPKTSIAARFIGSLTTLPNGKHIRPEHLTLTDHKPGLNQDEHAVSGIIQDRIYRGRTCDYLIKTADDLLLTVTTLSGNFNHYDLQTSHPVWCQWRERDELSVTPA